MVLKIKKDNREIQMADSMWLDILRIIYLRDKGLFQILKTFTEQLEQKDFDMLEVTYREKRKYKK